MRTRKEIEKDRDSVNNWAHRQPELARFSIDKMQLEVLLDIRDVLSNQLKQTNEKQN
jgi:hypothetical protein